jgi:hypothetical protein
MLWGYWKLSRAIFILAGTVLLVSSCGHPYDIGATTKDEWAFAHNNTDLLNEQATIPVSQFQLNTDWFEINHGKKMVDLLVIDDNSGSMKYEQSNMAARIASLFGKLQDFDYQIGIISTDVTEDQPGKDGRFLEIKNRPGQYILKSESMSQGDIIESFSLTVQREEKGSGNEQGALAAYKAITRSQSPDPENRPNREFFRNGAALVVVIITDTDETWANGQNFVIKSASELTDYVGKIFPGKRFSWNSIIVKPEDSSCLSNTTNNNENENYGNLYFALSQRTGGVVGSVCEADYGNQLGEIGNSVIEMTKTFRLKCNPVDINEDNIADFVIQSSNISFNRTDVSIKNENELSIDEGFPGGKYQVDYYCLKVP